MNLKLRRLARTPHSEKLGLYDLDERDDQGRPINFGLLHLHYLPATIGDGDFSHAAPYWKEFSLSGADQHLVCRRHGSIQ